ncbi:aldose epimerase family protein [Massilia endophytica]|uniref:aldose epimerase family protein n=1 Tax=Massilia endophytica TaxID=2899220 RepID=UPI001E5897F2|nr:aldose epimerase family protein [Massilia endophytica]UGQ45775.1 galactose mutarotase [Massilia endophytica]
MRIALAIALLCAAGQGGCTGITVQPFGFMPTGEAVEKVTLANERGMRLSYIDYGATLLRADVADRQGRRRNIILNLPDLPSYLRTQRRFAAVIGRYAGRIGNARYTLDGVTIQLPANAKGTALHGDPHGYDKRLWKRRDFADAASIGSVYTLVSPDGDQGHPGRLEVSVTYRLLRKRDEFRIEYEARSDAPTVVNLTNHAYFNLAGAGSEGIASHRFRFGASRYAVTDEKKVPTGELAPVRGTPLDFTRPASAGANPAFDHSLVFDRPGLVAVIDETESGRRMEVRTSEPSAQFNTGGGFDGSETGGEGRAYQRNDGFAFETQHLSDSPNQPGFPSTVLRPGQVFRSWTSFRFSIAK